MTKLGPLGLSIIIVSISGSAWARSDSIVRNPLYDLKEELCVLPQPKAPDQSDQSDQSDPPKVRPVWFDADGDILTSSPVSTPTARPFLQVDRNHMIQELLERYPVQLDYMALIREDAQAKSDPQTRKDKPAIARVLADALAPCRDPLALVKNRDQSDRVTAPTDDDSLKKACHPNNIFKDPETRFTKKKANLRFRRALLRLFHAAETGSSRAFIVQRRNVAAFETIVPTAPGTLNGEPTSFRTEQWSPSTYQPLLNASADDVMIRRFILDDAQPFIILCRGSENIMSEDTPPKRYPARVDLNTPPSNLPNSENAATRVSELAHLGDALNDLKEGSKTTTKAWVKTRNLAVIKSPEEFSKISPAKAEVGLSEDAAGDAVTAHAAMGIKFQYKSNVKETEPLTTHTIIPFISIEQEPTDDTIFIPIETSTGVIRGRRGTEKIAFANITGGLRYELRFDDPAVTAAQALNRHSGVRGIPVGQRPPGWRVGLTGEYVTDNYLFQKGERYGVDLSLPRLLPVTGFRQRQPLLSLPALEKGEARSQNALGLGRAVSGWSTQWDFRPALDYVDWDEGRTPFNFDTPQGNDRIGEAVFETALFGYDFEIDLLKANAFGAVLGDFWFKVKADYSYRYGYNDQIVDRMTQRNKAAHRFTLGTELMHPDFENLSFGVDFTTGEDFKTLAETENIAFNIKAGY